jgi:hypothetical protein
VRFHVSKALVIQSKTDCLEAYPEVLMASALAKVTSRVQGRPGNLQVTDNKQLEKSFRATSDPLCDVNDDGMVDGADLAIVIANWGECR